MPVNAFESNESELTVYPNPTSDLLFISPNIFVENPEFLLSIYDITGKLVMSKTITMTDNQISLEPFKTGIYLAHLSGGDIVKTRQIIKE